MTTTNIAIRTPFSFVAFLFIVCLLVPFTEVRAGEQTSYFVEGPELWLDGPEVVQPGSDSEYPDIAIDPLGRLVVAWDSFNGGGDGWDVYVRRLMPDGTPLGDPMLVNTTLADDQKFPRVAVASDGTFVVLWQSLEFDSNVGQERYWVRSQAFDANGDPSGGQELVSALSSGNSTDISADIATLGGGGYVVVWESSNTNGTDQNQSIQARLLNTSGIPTGGQFQCNTEIAGTQSDSAVAGLIDGGFLVTWVGPDAHGRRFDSAGMGVGDDFDISTEFSSAQANTDIAVDGNGRIAVVWEDDDAPGDNREIRGRLFDAGLAPEGIDFRINGTITNDQQYPRVGGLEEGSGFFVTWRSNSSPGNDTDVSVQGRVVTGTGTFEGPQIQLNLYIPSSQQQPAVGVSNERVTMAWKSGENAQVSSSVITGRVFDHCIFCDGFETGDTSRWSGTSP